MDARDGEAPRPTELLEQFRLADRAKRRVIALSGGMAQRLMVARAIMHRPSILFLDEPTAGLDPQSRIALWEILGELHADGQTILLTTHYMEEADQLCDRVAIIDHGRIARPRHARAGSSARSAPTRWSRSSADGDLERARRACSTRDRGRDRRRRRSTGRRARRTCGAPRGVLPTRRRRRRAQRLRRHRPVGRRADARDRLHQPHREGPARMSATTVAHRARRRCARRPPRLRAFGALLLRDLTVLRKNLKEFIPRTILQPLLLVFVFTYVFPKIGQGVGGRGRRRLELLDAARRRRGRDRDHLPGHPGGRAAAGAGVRLHPRDRGPRARAAAGLGSSRSRRSSPARCRACSPALIVFPIAYLMPLGHPSTLLGPPGSLIW